jgi:hypothetical protein
MKTERRHDLDTNELSKRLDTLAARVGPHMTTIATVVLVVAALAVAGLYMRKSSTAAQEQAWDAYNLAIEGRTPDLDILQQSAEEHAGTEMADWANVTWADGMLWRATRQFIRGRSVANENMNSAEGVYVGLLGSTTDPRIRDRANFGLARIYELRNDLGKAREHYLQVGGAFSSLAADRAEVLETDRVIETWDWLASAQPAPLRQPLGGGFPGQKPEFGVEDFEFPAEGAESDVAGPDFGDLLENFGRSDDEQTDRYQTGEESADEELAEESAEEPSDGEASDAPPVDEPTGDDAVEDTVEESVPAE